MIEEFNMSRSLFLAAALILSATIAQSAFANSKTERIDSITVRVSDLDLQKDADVQTLLGRLQRAAVKACGGNPRFHPSYALMPRHTTEVFQQCRRNAIATAVTTIGAPKLASALALTTAEGGM
jgi:UrcA family protein